MKIMNERQLVTILTHKLKKNEKSKIYIHIDRDAPGLRHTRSGWDFIAAKNGHVVFCEAKIKTRPLTDWQRYVQCEVALAGCEYVVIRFFHEGGRTWSVCNEVTGEYLSLDGITFEFLIGGGKHANS